MASEKWIPYMMTTSLRKIIDSMRNHPNRVGIPVARGCVETGESTEDQSYPEVGITITTESKTKVELDWYGSSLWLDRVETRLDEIEPHDMSVRFMRLRFKGSDEFVDTLKGKWDRVNPDLSKGKFEIEDGVLNPNGYFYLDLRNEKPMFDINDYDVKSDVSWREYWKSLNDCEICGAPLLAHGFNRRMLEVVGLESKEINENVRRGARPNFNAGKGKNCAFLLYNDITSWISENIVAPTGYRSPNGRLYYRKGKEEQWVLERV